MTDCVHNFIEVETEDELVELLIDRGLDFSLYTQYKCDKCGLEFASIDGWIFPRFIEIGEE